MEGEIQFIANYDDWKIIKKLKITEVVPALDIVDFLASMSISFDGKIEANLRKSCNLKIVDDYIASLVTGKTKSEAEFAKILKGLASPNAGKAITASIPEGAEPKEKDKIKVYLKIYMTKTALSKAGLEIDYTKVPIPVNKGK